MKGSERAGNENDGDEKKDAGIEIFRYADEYGQSNLYLEIAKSK
jgi:hypothetical protein